MTWKIAGVQMDCKLGDVAGNRAAIEAQLRVAAAAGARLVVFPECVLSGYCFTSKAEAWPHAEPIPGPSTEALAAVCRQLGVWAVVGMLEAEPATERLYNAAVLLGPDGVVGVYRKVHLPHLGVDRFTTSGTRPFAVHTIDGLRVGMSICYDGSFPETARCLMLEGADLIVLPTNWPPGARQTARLIPPARALENTVYFAAVNRVGTERGFSFIGLSSIVNPFGETLAAAENDRPTILYATIDPTKARQKHLVHIPGEYEVHRTRDRRPEIYAPLVRPVRQE
jgi:predicted amidohydrolase